MTTYVWPVQSWRRFRPDPLPAAWALRHIRIVALGIGTVVPIGGLWRRLFVPLLDVQWGRRGSYPCRRIVVIRWVVVGWVIPRPIAEAEEYVAAARMPTKMPSSKAHMISAVAASAVAASTVAASTVAASTVATLRNRCQTD